MKIDSECNENVATVTISGEISFTYVNELKGEIDSILSESLKALILDFTDVSFIDSTGLSVLMRCHAHMMRVGGKCVLVGTCGGVSKVLRIMKLDKVLTMAETLEEARTIIQV